MASVEMLIFMLGAHALLDYPLQGDWLSKAKNPTLNLVPGETIWPMALGSHVLIQALGVKIVTGSWTFAALEFVIHFATDYAKCRGAFGYNVDQIIHVGTKVLFFALLLIFGVLP